MRYFRVFRTPYGRWLLDEPSLNGEMFDIRPLQRAKPVSLSEPLRTSIWAEGPEINFSFTAFGLPIVTQEVSNILRDMAGDTIQWIPCIVDGLAEIFEIPNILAEIDCLDLERSNVIYPDPPSDLPEDEGNIRHAYTPTFLASRLHDNPIFRLKRWGVPIFVNEQVKDVLERLPVTGVEFQEIPVV